MLVLVQHFACGPIEVLLAWDDGLGDCDAAAVFLDALELPVAAESAGRFVCDVHWCAAAAAAAAAASAPGNLAASASAAVSLMMDEHYEEVLKVAA